MIGRLLGHYRIVEQIGGGGMGVVYRAHDGHLRRDVAIKVLPESHMRDDRARRRFRREALALSQLNHPNIATIHDFDHHEGVDILVMELVSGESLDNRIRRGPMPESEVRSLGLDLAHGLAAAHAQGVLHRDLKPANLHVTQDGRLKILDFGLSRLIEPQPGVSVSSLTHSSAIFGTFPYLAPEQLDGRTADARTDIYAAGVVLFEAATGRLPFAADNSARLVYSILNEPAPNPRELCPELSPALEGVILHALSKDPAHRPATADELAQELESVGSPDAPMLEQVAATRAARHASRRFRWLRPLAITTGVALLALAGWFVRQRAQAAREPELSLAVLPFANLSGDPEQEFFADGMTDELITELSKVGSLRVISRTSTMRYKNSRKPLSQIARELRVNRLVEGSVVRDGSRVRITATLLDAKADRGMWTERYDRDQSSVLELQTEVANAVVEQIRAHVTTAERARLTRFHDLDPVAYEAYLRGRYHMERQNEASYRAALDYFQLAVRTDPSSAMAWTGVADAYYMMSSVYMPAKESMPRAREAAQRALELDPELGPSHASLGVVLAVYDWNWKEAEEHFRRAIELSPSHATSHYYYASLTLILGRMDEATAHIGKTCDLDPLSNFYACYAAWVDLAAGRVDRAITGFDAVVARDSLDAQPHFSLAICYAERGMFDKAIAEGRRAATLADHPAPWAILGNIYARAGRRTEALEALKRVQPNFPPFQATYPARIYVGLGMFDDAFACIRTALDRRDEDVTYIAVDPLFRPLRSDPRFREVLRRLGLPLPTAPAAVIPILPTRRVASTLQTSSANDPPAETSRKSESL